jgi:hypothetical protein
MRFTPSANWNAINASSHRVLTWNVYVKKTTALDDALTAGTWLDVTSFITNLDSISSRIEYELGQFSSDSLSFIARDIDWWEANVFDATEAQYLEMKITAALSNGSTVATDVCYAFIGFIDKADVTYTELDDTVSFSVFTADELGNRLSILGLNTQYLNEDVDGAGLDGVVLPRLRGFYVTDCNISSYSVAVGLHTLEYINADNTIKFDDGTALTVTAGENILLNGDGTQKIKLWVMLAEIEPYTTPVVDYIIVTSAATLPRQPYYGLSIGQYLKLAYTAIGISTASLNANNSLKILSHDGTKRLSYYDSPPNSSIITGEKYGVIFDGTSVWVGIDNKLYQRSAATEVYTLVTQLTAGNAIVKMFYNARNNEIWLCSSSTADRTKIDGVTSYLVAQDVLSNTITLTASAGLHTAALMDDTYDIDEELYKYCMIVAESSTYTITVKEITSDLNGTLTIGTITATTSAAAIPQTGFGIVDDTGVRYVYSCSFNAADPSELRFANYNTSGVWDLSAVQMFTSNGEIFTTNLAGGVYEPVSKRIYYWVKTGTYNLYALNYCDATAVDDLLYSAAGVANTDAPVTESAAVADGEGNIYWSSDASGFKSLYIYDKSAVVNLGAVSSVYGAMFYDATTEAMYGLDDELLYQHAAQINLYTKKVFDDTSIKNVLTQLLQAFNLVANISSHKKVSVLRRGNDAGTIQTSGSSITLNTGNVSSIVKMENNYQKIALVSVSNGVVSTTYDGTSFDVAVLSDAKQLSISNDVIPDNIVKDLAKFFFTFYNSTHDKYILTVDQAKLEYEVLDGAAVTFAGTKIEKTATGLITAEQINSDGSLQLEVVF